MSFAESVVKLNGMQWRKLKVWGKPLKSKIKVTTKKHAPYEGTCWESGEILVELSGDLVTKDRRLVEGFVVMLHELAHAYLFREIGHHIHDMRFKKLLLAACEEASGYNIPLEPSAGDYRLWDLEIIDFWMKKEMERIHGKKKISAVKRKVISRRSKAL